MDNEYKLSVRLVARIEITPEIAAMEAEIAKIGEAQYVKNSLEKLAQFQKKMEDDALLLLSLYWSGHDAKARKHTLTLAPMEEWLGANQPLDRWFFVHLIEAAGAKAIELGYSQYKSDIAKGKNAGARIWVLEAWNKRQDKGQGKASFSRVCAPLVKKKFDLNITADTIARDWLPKGQS